MLYNKNNVRKTNDKKILHKVGKQWKVISVALLMAVAGGAVATHAANAAETNDADNASVNTLVNTLNSTSLANAPRTTYHASANSTSSSAASSSATIQYYPGSNGSAAKYFDKVDQDNAKVEQYRPTVNAYVQSLNAEYNPQVRSFATTSNSARNAASNDSKLANSYSAVANKNTTMSTVNSLAAANHMNPTLYQGMVQNNEQAFSDAVSSASDDVKANSDVASLVNSLEGINFTSASMSASASDVIANSNYVGAEANYKSVAAEFDLGTENTDLANVASELSYGADELYAKGNPAGYSAIANSLAKNVNNVNINSLTVDLSSAVSTAYSSASARYSASAKNNANLSDYAEGHYFNGDAFVTGFTSPTLDNDGHNDLNANGDFNTAVSAATDIRFAPVLASAANSLFASYGTQYGTYTTRSKEAKSAVASASAEVRSAQYAQDYASANYNVIKYLADYANNHDGKSGAAASFLNKGVTNFEIGLDHMMVQNPDYNSGKYVGNIQNSSKYLVALAKSFGNNNGNNYDTYIVPLLNAYDGYSKGSSNYGTEQGFSNFLSTNKKYFNNVNDFKVGNSSIPMWKKAAYNAAHISANDANGLQGYTIDDNVPEFVPNTDTFDNGDYDLAATQNSVSADVYDVYADALLSAGVDIRALASESGAVDHVANAASSASASLNNANDKTTGAARLGEELNVAANSANSALNSATSASAEYSTANDENVTLANYFATSYASDANKESDVASNASAGLDGFFQSVADDSTFNSADNAYNSAESAATNDYKLGVANAQSIYNSNAHFLDVLKGARLHSTPHFGSKKFDDKVVGSVKAGDRLTVHGVNVSRNGDIRGVIRYYVTDNTTGAKGFFTGQANYSKPAYLNATTADANVNIKTLKPVQVYSEINGKKAVATVPANKVLENATVVYDNDSRDAYGFTKVQTANGDFLTANTDYVEILTPTVNTNNNAPQSNFSGINLQGGQHMADYYNNFSQD